MNRVELARFAYEMTGYRVDAQQRRLRTLMSETATLTHTIAQDSDHLTPIQKFFFEHILGEPLEYPRITLKICLQKLAIILTGLFQFAVPFTKNPATKKAVYLNILAASPPCVWEMVPISLSILIQEIRLLMVVHNKFAA